MNTRALLARLHRLRGLMETPEAASDYKAEELAAISHLIAFKSDPRWKTAWREIKTELATREHVTNMPRRGSRKKLER